MNFQSAGSGVTFGAPRMCALEGLLSSMSQFVSLQMTFSDELLVTLIADKRTLSSVGPHVCFQVACLRKLFEALLERTHEYLLLLLRPLHLFDLSYISFALYQTYIMPS